MNIYKYIDYQLFLKATVIERKKVDKSFTFERFAKAIGVQKPYLSKVVNRKAHLSQDQMYSVGKVLDFNKDELEYALKVLELAKTGLANRKKELHSEVEALRTQKLDSGEWLTNKPLDAIQSGMAEYYLDPWHQIVHLLLSVKRYREDPTKISIELGIRAERLQSILQKLERMGIIAREKEGIQILVRNIHLPKDSPLYDSWRNNVRLLSLQQLQVLPPEKSYNFSMFFSADLATYRTIHAGFLEFLKTVDTEVKKAPYEEVYQLTFDLLPWTKK